MRARFWMMTLTIAVTVLAFASPSEARRWRRGGGWYGGGGWGVGWNASPGWNGGGYGYGGGGYAYGNGYGSSGWSSPGWNGGYADSGYGYGDACNPVIVGGTTVAPVEYAAPSAGYSDSTICCY